MSKPVSKQRRKVLKASAVALLLPNMDIIAEEAPPKTEHNFGIAGRMAPELIVPTWIDGKGKPTTFKLADHRGKFVFMEFWQYWCPGCHKHGFPGLKKISDALKDNPHFTALSIQTVFEGSWINTKGKMKSIQNKYELHDIVMGHETGKDSGGDHPATMINYRSGGTPWAVVIAPNGRVIFNDFQINIDAAITYIKRETDKMS